MEQSVMFERQAAAIEGVQRAVDHANRVNKEWQNKALDFFTKYAEGNLFFTTEDVREASKYRVPEPPDARAWGAIATIAKRNEVVSKQTITFYKSKKYHN